MGIEAETFRSRPVFYPRALRARGSNTRGGSAAAGF